MNLFYILNTNTKMLLYSKPDSCWNLSIQNHDVCNYHSDLKIKINIGSERLRVPFLLGISPTWNVWFSVLRHLCVGFFFSPTHQEMCEERRPSYVAPKSCILLIHGWWQWMGAGISPPPPPRQLVCQCSLALSLTYTHENDSFHSEKGHTVVLLPLHPPTFRKDEEWKCCFSSSFLLHPLTSQHGEQHCSQPPSSPTPPLLSHCGYRTRSTAGVVLPPPPPR